MLQKIAWVPWNPVVSYKRNGFNLTVRFNQLDIPTQSRIPRTYVVGLKGDLFQAEVPLGFIQLVFNVINRCPYHSFIIITKRPDIIKYASGFTWSNNISVGVSIDSYRDKSKIDDLRKVPAKIRFILMEPFTSPTTGLNLKDVQMLIVNAEYGSKSYPKDTSWINEIYEMCIGQNVKLYFCQFTGLRPGKQGQIIEGQELDKDL